MSLSARCLNKKNFSNIILFEKRANDFKSKKKELFNSKIQKNKKLSIKSTKNLNFPFPILSNSTMTLFPDLKTQISFGIKLFENSLYEIKNKKDIKQNQNESKLTVDNNKNKTFLTDSIKINLYRKKSAFNSSNNNNNIKNNSLINTLKNSPNKTFLSNRNTNSPINKNFSNINNANILLFFQKEKNTNNDNNIKLDKKIFNKKLRNKLFKEKINNNNNNNNNQNINSSDIFKKIINCKMRLINPKNINLTNYIEETKQLKINKYTLLMKKENYKRAQENKINNIDYYNNIYKNLENKKKLFNIKFIEKLGDYVKYINSQKELEKVKNENLFNDIIKLKNEIKQLNKNIAKKISYKKNILKWIYFQIQLKEKKINLPSYYRTILENNDIKKDKYEEENKNIKKERKHYSIEIRSSKKHFSKKILLKNQDKEFSSEKGLFFYNEIDLENPINLKEIIKIKNYKKTPIYNSVEEFNDVFVFYDNQNIAKMKYYYNLKMQIYQLKIELQNLKKKIRENEIYYNNSVQVKEIELNKIDDCVKGNNNLKQELSKNINKDSSFVNNSYQNSHYLILNQNKEKEEDKMCLLDKVNILFNTCKSLNIEQKLELSIDKKDKKNYKNNNELYEILYKLKYITFIIDYLISKFKIYNSIEFSKNKLLIKLKNEIEKNHKIEKAAEQRLQFEKKAIKLRKKLEERNNKIYFLPYRKIDINNNKKDSKNKNKSFDINNIQKMNFEDFLNNN